MQESVCGRFVVFRTLYIDRATLAPLAAWAVQRGLRVEDAIQIAVCAFDPTAYDSSAVAVPAEREHEGGIRLLGVP